MLWKSYIDFEIEQEEFGNTRNLYKRLLQRTQHVKVRTAVLKKKFYKPGNFKSRCDSESSSSSSRAGLDQLRQVRAVHRRPRPAAEVSADLRGGQQEHEELRGEGGAADAARVLERLREGVRLRKHHGKSQEAAAGEGEEEEEADCRGRGKNHEENDEIRSVVAVVTGFNLFSQFFQSDAGWEEYYDYIFPEDAANQPNLKLLAMAKMWKRQQIVNEEVVPEIAPGAEEATSSSSSPSPPPSTSDEAAAPPENGSDRNAAAEAEQEKTYDDRDDDDSSSESDSDDEDDGKKEEEEEEKPSPSGDEDKD